MQLVNAQEVIERSIYHGIRSVVVELGYLPDIYTYDLENPNITIAEAEQERYQQDLYSIKQNMGFVVELFNYSTSQQRGKLKAPRLVIETESFGIGMLGVDPTLEYEKVQGVFKKKKNADILTDLYFNIRMIAKSSKQQRLLHQVIVNALPRKGYIKKYTENSLRPNNNLFVRYMSYADLSWTDEGILEKVYRYQIPDVNEVERYVQAEDVAPINNIILEDIKFLDNE